VTRSHEFRCGVHDCLALEATRKTVTVDSRLDGWCFRWNHTVCASTTGVGFRRVISNPRFPPTILMSLRLLKYLGGHLKSLKSFKIQHNVALKSLAGGQDPSLGTISLLLTVCCSVVCNLYNRQLQVHQMAEFVSVKSRLINQMTNGRAQTGGAWRHPNESQQSVPISSLSVG
jgi:hypothetical protein